MTGRLDLLADGLATVVGLALAVTAGLWPQTGGVAAAALIASVGAAGWIVVSDVRTLTIADGASVLIGLAGLARRLTLGDAPLLTTLVMVVQALIVGGLFYAVREVWYRRRGYDGLGLGDVKLAAAGTLAIGVEGLSVALFLAALAGLLVFALVLRRRDARLPLGALLAPLIVAVELVDPDGFALMALLGGGVG